MSITTSAVTKQKCTDCLLYSFDTGYNSAFGSVERFELKLCCIKMKSLLPTLIHHGHTLKSS